MTNGGISVSESIVAYVAKKAEMLVGQYGYSPIGAVVGATYPKDAAKLRRMMPVSYFLVPGYGAQGGGADDILPCFNPDGLGAVVNSSRGILYSHMSDGERNACSREEYLESVRKATFKMREDIYSSLKMAYPEMVY